MNLRCFFGHKYCVVCVNPVEIFNPGEKLPVRFETNFLFQCKRCQQFKTQVVDGYFPKNDDDEGGDDDTPPILSPDDFYESLGKL